MIALFRDFGKRIFYGLGFGTGMCIPYQLFRINETNENEKIINLLTQLVIMENRKN